MFGMIELAITYGMPNLTKNCQNYTELELHRTVICFRSKDD